MPFTSTTRDVPAARRSSLWRRLVLLTLVVLCIGTAYWQTNKSLPPGLHVDSPWVSIAPRDVTFIADITSADAYGRPVVSQAIFDQILDVIHSARKFVVLDYYLFNSQRAAAGGAGPVQRQICDELRDALVERRRSLPDLQVLFIADPINEAYGNALLPDLQSLRAAGVQVVITNLNRLRDSNYIYSSLWRLAVGWWSGGQADPGHDDRGASLPNPLDESSPVRTLGAWLRVLNFKSNQRQVVLADDGAGRLLSIVGSANPHDASSSQSNTALKVRGNSMLPLLRSELAVARFSGWNGHLETELGDAGALSNLPKARSNDTPRGESTTEGARARVLTEGAIGIELLQRLQAAAPGDSIDIAMFYISDRSIVEALLAAARRRVNVRLILDPNRDAFGHAKTGIPNQPVASELVAASDGAIHVRWYRTHGEQFHARLAMVRGPQRLWVTVGSANLTRRSLADYNLQANVAIEVEQRSALAQQLVNYFDTLWSNRASLGIEYTADFGYYADPSQLHYWLYRVMEGTGVSIF